MTVEARTTFALTRAALAWAIAFLLWATLPPGAFLIIIRQYDWGTFLLAAGVAIAILAATPGNLRRLEARRILKMRAYAMITGWVLCVLLTAVPLFLVSDVFGQEGRTAAVLYIIVLGIILAMAIQQLLVAIRSSN